MSIGLFLNGKRSVSCSFAVRLRAKFSLTNFRLYVFCMHTVGICMCVCVSFALEWKKKKKNRFKGIAVSIVVVFVYDSYNIRYATMRKCKRVIHFHWKSASCIRFSFFFFFFFCLPINILFLMNMPTASMAPQPYRMPNRERKVKKWRENGNKQYVDCTTSIS